MIAFLNGIIASKGESELVLDVHGVGYLLHMAGSSIGRLPAPGEEAKVLCTMSVSDAGIFLYGFMDERERSMFERMTTVSGVGPKLALAALSLYDPDQLAALFASQDIKALSKVPGIGKKTASRLVLELKDAFGIEGQLSLTGDGVQLSKASEPVAEALASMGFTVSEISAALEGMEEGLSESEMLQYALRRM